ncbi:uncharacterized protein LOC141855569 [Brevipalpus obovatus]|uniref:uncharacterized protein LOC141855569 n=1 Tax=Brevipalpus obovatus TaxID=246614 RepID=UPI003D9EB1F4
MSTRYTRILSSLGNFFALPKVIVAGACATALGASVIYGAEYALEDQYEFLVEGKSLISRNVIVKNILGEPIKFKRIRFVDTLIHRIYDDNAMIAIEFKGSRKQAFANIYGMRYEGKWALKRVEVRLFEEHVEKKMIIYTNETESEAEIFAETI